LVPKRPRPGETPKPASTVALKTFRDREAGISISYPTSWVEIENNSGQKLTDDENTHIRLVAGPSRQEAALKVRVRPLAREIINSQTSKEQLAATQSELDGLIAGPNVKVLQRRVLSVNGMVTWFYLYQFIDAASGTEGAHSHYFLFDGAKMNVIVMEALPRSKFTKLAPVFDQILQSFTSARRNVSSPAPSPGR
jgi:hypothetical protein